MFAACSEFLAAGTPLKEKACIFHPSKLTLFIHTTGQTRKKKVCEIQLLLIKVCPNLWP